MNKKRNIIVCLVILFCAVMAVVDAVIMADYFTKSAIKLVIFLVLPTLYCVYDKELEIKQIFKIKKQGLIVALGLGVAVYAVILGGYFLLKDVFDFSGITKSLTSNIGVSGKNFIYVSLYISFVNSLLEEYFFRGFAFLALKKVSSGAFAYIFSAAIFSIYHIAMMIGWFSPIVFVIVLLGLFIGGLIFNRLNESCKSIYPSWIVHMFANFAINTVGFILFGII